MKEIILIKNGEIALKGLNRGTFEDVLVKNIKRRLSPYLKADIKKSQSTIMIDPINDDADMDAAAEALKRVFGIAGFSRAAACEKDMEVIKSTAVEYLKPSFRDVKTFKVEAKRSDKSFPLNSPQICNELGGEILSNYPYLKVDVHNPDLIVNVEVRDQYAFIHGNQIKGAGGMPTGTSGRAAVMISGGIDSPVAAWTMAKRGLVIDAIHFASPPYTSQRAEQKVHELLGKVSRYSGTINLLVVPFTEIQERIKDDCPEEYFTIIMRRMMMRIAVGLAKKQGCGALITGESLAQVASQTLWALGCTDAVATIPVFRPLIGMDKNEIVEISRKIDTFDISIQPYEDCCTVFTPKHPKLRPSPEEVEAAEKALDIEDLINRAIEGVKLTIIDHSLEA
ncbi:MAG: tRNA 4-thiouridine(8) synthase ThiI [Clostridia bacterium]|nr:tRNA 4-thiouridine(8) synthase ThiI [Clostridia bacterium]MBR5991353.1 tRNA 4-thiouridine(8) synthase ThiI [Clostridia bacterium]MBR6479461.1 tRNA 4-thiouridine(8) synthase ThiI [Clostridia bacterium]MBR6513124.1 tRNA 4-thiouridine(8) synthase ThiI [Clostridia bacterium]